MKTLTTTIDGRIGRLTLARPDSLNPLSTQCLEELAEADAWFDDQPEVDLGIPLTWGGIPRLVREIGPAMTRELVLTCRPFDAAEAREIGLVNRVVGDDQLASAVDDLARSLATKSALTLEATLTAVDAAAEALVPTDGAVADADLFLAAIADAETS